MYWNDVKQVYTSKISYMGKTYPLGEFKCIEDAENVRKQAEKEILDGTFLRWYNKRYFTKSSKDNGATIIGSKFKTFTVTGFDRKDEGYHRYWTCECYNCGETRSIREDRLLKLKFKKCKCDSSPTKSEQQMPKIKKVVYDTNIGLVIENKPMSNSKSGIRGVYWDDTRGKWMAQITFRKKRYTLGRFDNMDDAIVVRKKAEEKIYGNFLEWYEKHIMTKNNYPTNKEM